MKLSECANQARARLEAQLADLGISGKLADEIIGRHTLVNYSKGSMVFLHGSPAEVLYCVFAGLVKIYCPRPDGMRIMVGLAGPGDVIGHVDYIDPRHRLAQAFEGEAMTRCSVALFTRERVLNLLQYLDKTTLLRIVERLNTAWSSMAQRFGTLLSMSFRDRLEVVLTELGAKFGVRDARGVVIMPELSHTDLADMIGSSRAMVSRLIAEMIEEGVLLREGKQFILLDVEKFSFSSQPADPVGELPQNLAGQPVERSRLRNPAA